MTKVGIEFFGVDAGARAQCQAAITQLERLKAATIQQTEAAVQSAEATAAGAEQKVAALVEERQVIRSNMLAYQQLAAAATRGSEQQVAATRLATEAQAQLGATSQATASRVNKAANASVIATRRLVKPILGLTAIAGYLGYSYEHAMQRLRTSAGASQEEVERMTKNVLELAKTAEGGAQGPQKLAEALYYLESAGIRGDDALSSLSAAAVNAYTTGADLVEVTKSLAAVQETQIEGTESETKAMGTLNAIVGAGMMTFEDLTAALSTGVLPVAENFGITLAQLGAAIDTFTIAQMPAQQATTKLTATFSRMMSPTGAAAKALKNLGIEQQELGIALQRGGLTDALALLVERYRAVETESGKVYASQNLMAAFGRARGGAQVLALVEGWETYNRALEQVNRTTREYQRNAKAAMETPSAKVAIAISQIRTELTEAGVELLPALARLAAGFSKVVRQIASVTEAVGGWETAFKILLAGVLVNKIGNLILWMTRLRTAVLGVATAETTMGATGSAAFAKQSKAAAIFYTRLLPIIGALIAVNEGLKALTGQSILDVLGAEPAGGPGDLEPGFEATERQAKLMDKLFAAVTNRGTNLPDSRAVEKLLEQFASIGVDPSDILRDLKILAGVGMTAKELEAQGMKPPSKDLMLAIQSTYKAYQQIWGKRDTRRVASGMPMKGTSPGAGTHAQSDWQSANAIDIVTREKDPIYAPESGKVIKIGGIDPSRGVVASGTKRLYGWSITLAGASGNEYYIAHLASVIVKAGASVKAGQLIGYAGALGHVHFAVAKGSPWTAAGYKIPPGARASASEGQPSATTARDTYYNPPSSASGADLSEERASARTLVRQVQRILSPTLRARLREQAAKLNAAYQHVGSDKEREKLSKRLTTLQQAVKDGLDLSAQTRKTRTQAQALAKGIELIVTPALRARLRQQVAQLNKALRDVASEKEQRAIEAKLKKLKDALSKALEFDRETEKLRLDAMRLAREIAGLPAALQGALNQSLSAIFQGISRATTDEMLAAVQDQVDALQEAYEKALAKLESAVEKPFNKLGDGLLRLFDAETERLKEAVRATVRVLGQEFEIGLEELTPAEKRLKEMEDYLAGQDAGDRIADARKALEQAHKLRPGWDGTLQEIGERILEAERELNRALEEEQRRALEERAEAERKAADEALEKKQDEIDDQRDALRDQLEERLATIQEELLSNEPEVVKKGQEDLAALMADPAYQALFEDAGDLIGNAFAQGMTTALGQLTTAIDDLVDALTSLSIETGGATIVISPSGTAIYGEGAQGGVIGDYTHAFAGGGRVPGVFVGREDTVMGRLTPGETVIDRSLTRELERFLSGGGSGAPTVVVNNHFHKSVLGMDVRRFAKQTARATQAEIGRLPSYQHRRG